jgi:hypothetical protein
MQKFRAHLNLVARTREERGLEPLKKNKFVIPKSRYDSIGREEKLLEIKSFCTSPFTLCVDFRNPFMWL